MRGCLVVGLSLFAFLAAAVVFHEVSGRLEVEPVIVLLNVLQLCAAVGGLLGILSRSPVIARTGTTAVGLLWGLESVVHSMDDLRPRAGAMIGFVTLIVCVFWWAGTRAAQVALPDSERD